MAVWVDGKKVLDFAGIPAELYPPWNLRNPDLVQHVIDLGENLSPREIVVRLTREPDQSARGYAVLSTHERIPVPADPGALRWWHGDAASLVPGLGDQESRSWQLDVPVPPGARSVTVHPAGHAELLLDGQPIPRELTSDGSLAASIEASDQPEDRVLQITVSGVSRANWGAVITRPVYWHCEAGRSGLGPWTSIGLGDFSGIVKYSTTFGGVESHHRVVLHLGAIKGSARVLLNGTVVGELLVEPWAIDLTPHVTHGTNVLDVEVASALAEHYRTIPSPYSMPAQEGSGLLGPAWLEVSEGP
jgi:hypothetical protein